MLCGFMCVPSMQGDLGVASALLHSLAAALPRLAPSDPTEEARLVGQLRLLATLVKALDRRSLGVAGRGDLVGILIRGGLPFGISGAVTL